MARVIKYNLDANAPMPAITTPALMMQGDNLADSIQVTLQGGSLAGYTATYYLEREDGVRVPVNGTIDGDVVKVTLTEPCYRVPGYYNGLLRITNGKTGEKRTILRMAGRIASEGDGPILDEERIIPSIEDVIAKLNDMEQAIEAAENAIAAAEAVTQDAREAAEYATSEADKAIRKLEEKVNSGELNGRGLTILGYYTSLSDLQNAVQYPAAGDAYAVGSAAPYDTYIWDAVSSAWVDNGVLQGVPGEPGAKGETGDRGPAGVSAAGNLLDNSDFGAPVNQRRKTTYTGSGYTIDRWRTWNSAHGVQVIAGGVTVTGVMQQYVERADTKAVYTLAACDASGIIHLLTGVPERSPANDHLVLSVGSNGFVGAGLKEGAWVWAALYRGEYTADNLPEYTPKGRAVELTECQRYFWMCDNTYFTEGAGYAFDASTFRAAIVLPQEMRSAPVMSAENGNTVHYGIKVCAGGDALTPTTVSAMYKHNRACLTLTGEYTKGAVGVLRLESALSFTADL